ncbi:hypothetical protein Vid5_gp09 [Pantoea phage vB_PagS_Vid5]|uniref:Uncharacterized protein n=1 Tax=Pantoea phage vB_PagS_Vid5 TaxID=2099652 RepID=A0A2P1CKR6_9CAUD|nr:hypothetical protein FDJ45_gp009 [Pantoea phage vB_PagS_Vid5]AVJ51764.1 hypothetical protein Vid5_gp09 [Pantoea phage vB_PagS_Vid5]
MRKFKMSRAQLFLHMQHQRRERDSGGEPPDPPQPPEPSVSTPLMSDIYFVNANLKAS